MGEEWAKIDKKTQLSTYRGKNHIVPFQARICFKFPLQLIKLMLWCKDAHIPSKY